MEKFPLYIKPVQEVIKTEEIKETFSQKEVAEWERRLKYGFESYMDFEKAEGVADKIEDNYYKSQAYSLIAEAMVKVGLNPEKLLKKAEEIVGKIGDDFSRSEAYIKIAEVMAQAGLNPERLFKKAEEAANQMYDYEEQSQAYAAIAASMAEAGLFDKAEKIAEKIIKNYVMQSKIYAIIAASMAKAGLFDRAEMLFKKAEEAADKIENYKEQSQAYAAIAASMAEAGLFDRAKKITDKITDDIVPLQYCKSEAITKIAELKANIANLPTLKTIPEELKEKLLHKNNPQTIQALGYLFPDTEKTLTPEGTVSFQMGKTLHKKDSEENQKDYAKELSDAAFTGNESDLFIRALSLTIVHHSYERVSNILMQKLTDAENTSQQIRLLKTLVEIDNPKAQILATTLFTNKELKPDLRLYLAKKLLSTGVWDKNLIPVLHEEMKNGHKEEVGAVLSAMIKDLGLTPDKLAYEALKDNEKVYDDIGNTANGIFAFNGYEKGMKE